MKIFYQRFVLPITGKQHKYKESALEDNSPFQGMASSHDEAA